MEICNVPHVTFRFLAMKNDSVARKGDSVFIDVSNGSQAVCNARIPECTVHLQRDFEISRAQLFLTPDVHPVRETKNVTKIFLFPTCSASVLTINTLAIETEFQGKRLF